MSHVQQRINHARRRLTNDIFLRRLSLAVLLTATAWAAAIVAARGLALGVPLWHGSWIGAVLAGLVAFGLTLLARPSPLQAAVALDGAAGLKERLSTALLVHAAADPFAQAAVQDAEHVAAHIHVPAHIRHHAPALWPWSVATTIAALLLCQHMPTLHLFAEHRPIGTQVSRAALDAERVAIQTELDDQLNKIKDLANSNPSLKDVADSVQPLEMPDTPGTTPEDLRREAIKRIEDVRDQLERQLESAEQSPLKETKRMLSQIQPQGGDKAQAKLSQALAGGDFQGAQQAVRDMQKQLEDAAKTSDNPETQQKVAELQEQMAKLADQMNKLGDSVQLQKELENKAGLSEEDAKKLLHQIAQMDPKQLEKELQKQLGDKGLSQEQIQQLVKKIEQNQAAKKACQKMAQALSKAAQSCQQSDGASGSGDGASNAAGALAQAADQLSSLEMSEQMMNELQAQISDLENLRDRCGSGQCHGGKRPGEGNDRIGDQGPQYGLGLGDRIGKEKTPYKTDPTKAHTRYEGGSIIGQMLIDGPQIRGQVTKEALDAAEAEVRDALDAVEREQVPRQYEKALREYFERLAGLVREKRAATETAPSQ